MSKPRKILVTAALPYANGSIHVGHLVEYIQADIWSRFQRLRGHECYLVCADDTHGTAIMVESRKRGITPEQLIEGVWHEHTQDFKGFDVEFAHYSSTNSPENRELCEYFYARMKEKGHITTKSIEQLFCEHDKMFLPDRFVKGTCPTCKSVDQYGDSCDVCGATYQPSQMIQPYCSICRNPPVLRESEQLLFKVNDFRDFLQAWLPEHTSKEVAKKMGEWFNEPLRDWDISRNAPYFGFEIPGAPGKYFYVWVDAPMGYVATTKQLCDLTGMDFNEFWRSENTEVYHFIGKDIVYFHTLFWPALLKTADFRTPTQVFVHGHLTVNGQKMSKSKGTQVQAKTYLKHLEPGYLRYYYASKLGPGADDLDLSFDDFVNRVNSDLIGKITNLGSRGAQMLGKKFGAKLVDPGPEGLAKIQAAQAAVESIAAHFEAREFAKATSEIRAIADEANRFFDEKAPWKTQDSDPAATQAVLTTTLNLFRILTICLKPILPAYAVKVEKLFQAKPFAWTDIATVLTSGEIAPFEHLMQRIDPEKIEAIKTESLPKDAPPAAPVAAAATTKSAAKKTAAPAVDPMAPKPEIEIDAFSSVDLRVAQILSAEAVPEADKLLRLKVSLGPMGERQIFAGIKAAYDPATLVGRLTVVVANLKPRKMKFGMSEGMVLAAGPAAPDLFILSPDAGAKPGDPVK
ncbi:MAG: methionine--tRNA ligase [Bdellovibrionaceae bacterium]|nr:methionine--tRNA ligase [Pseudobdellovibrionaceae bacterium]